MKDAKEIYEDAKITLKKQNLIDKFYDSKLAFHFIKDDDGTTYFKTWLENRCPENINVIYDANSWIIFEDM